jgi:plastocyanin
MTRARPSKPPMLTAIGTGTRPHRLRTAALGATAVIGVTACSAANGASPNHQGAGGAMANMSGMGGTAPVSTPGAVTVAPRTVRKGDMQVQIVNFTFSPATVTIRAGQAVEWTNRDSIAHTVDFSGVISNVLNRGDTYAQRFTAPGTYHYICSIHPFMHGTVIVTA